MRKAVTLLTHRRPEYLRQTLAALARCDDLTKWKVRIVADRPDAQTRSVLADVTWPVTYLTDDADDALSAYQRVSRATLTALEIGFGVADFVAHLEEDVVPARDYLRWMGAQASLHKDDPGVFTVSPWWGSDGIPYTAESLTEIGFEPWFTPWGWGTWSDRFAEMRQAWDFDFWDRNLNEVVRRDRLTVHPLIARVKDIGAEGGVNGESEWRERQERTRPLFSEDFL